MASNERHERNPANDPEEIIPLKEIIEKTAEPVDEAIDVPTVAAAPSNPRDNVGVDDGLLDDGNAAGPTGPKPYPAGPDATEPGEFDVEEPEIGGGRGEHPRPEPRPRPRPAGPDATDPGEVDVEEPEISGGRGEHPRSGPRPRSRPDNPWKPGGPMYPHDRPDPSVNNGINYTTKKNIAQGMMDIALLTANASQLRYVMRSPYWDIYHQVNITLISISIALQIIAGVLLVFISRYDYKKKESKDVTQIMSDVVVIFIFAITVVNIFIATFGVDDERTTFLRWKQATTGDASSEPLFVISNVANSSHVHP